MLNSAKYCIDPALNKEKIFKYTPPPNINFSDLPPLNKNWLKELKKTCCEADSQLQAPFAKHLDKDSDYPLKDILTRQLKLIYHRLKGHLDSELSSLTEDRRKALIFKLTEEITHCTEGFHNRVNNIVDTFQKPRSLDELLYKARKSIVDNVATLLTSEVHAWNQVSAIASIDGLGVQANFPDDRYSGALSDETIRLTLQEAFEKNFTPFNIPCLLSNELMELIPELEVERHKPEGLRLETREKIVKYIKYYLPNSVNPKNPLDWQKYFNIYRDKKDPLNIVIQNLNWNAIYKYFYEALSTLGYFKHTPEIYDLIDAAYYNHFNLYGKNSSPYDPSEIISKLFSEENYLGLLEQLEELQTKFPGFYWEVTSNAKTPNKELTDNIHLLIPYLKQEFKHSNSYSEEIMQGFHLLTTLDSKLNEEAISQIAIMLAQKNRIDFTPLMFAALKNPEIIDDILRFLRQHKKILPTEIIQHMFLEKNKDNWNTLMIAANEHPDALKAILSFMDEYITDFNELLLQQIFLEKQINNYNILMLAASKHVETVMTILSFLTHNITSFANDTLGLLFTNKPSSSSCVSMQYPEAQKVIQDFLSAENGSASNVLMLAARNQPEAVKVILNFIAQHSGNFNSEMLQQMLLEKDPRSHSVFMLAASKQPEAVEAILSFIEQQHIKIDSNLVQQMFLEQDKQGNSALMLAASKQPIAVKTMLSFINRHMESCNPPMLQEIFLEKNQRGYSTLMLAANEQPEAVEAILAFIAENIEIFNPCLEKILIEKDRWNTTALMLAASKQPKSINHILNFITNHIEHIESQVLRELFLKKVYDYEANMKATFFGGSFRNIQRTVLIVAERNHPETAQAILAFIDEHIEYLAAETLIELFLEKDSKSNPFMKRWDSYPFKNILNFLVTSPDKILALIQEKRDQQEKNQKNQEIADILCDKLAKFLLKQLFVLKMDYPEDIKLIDKLLLTHSSLLLTYFDKDYFIAEPRKLAYVTEKLFIQYLVEITDRAANGPAYKSKFSVSNIIFWRYSANDKLIAAKQLKNVLLTQTGNLAEFLNHLKTHYSALTKGRLGKLFEAHLETAKQADGANDVLALKSSNYSHAL